MVIINSFCSPVDRVTHFVVYYILCMMLKQTATGGTAPITIRGRGNSIVGDGDDEEDLCACGAVGQSVAAGSMVPNGATALSPTAASTIPRPLNASPTGFIKSPSIMPHRKQVVPLAAEGLGGEDSGLGPRNQTIVFDKTKTTLISASTTSSDGSPPGSSSPSGAMSPTNRPSGIATALAANPPTSPTTPTAGRSSPPIDDALSDELKNISGDNGADFGGISQERGIVASNPFPSGIYSLYVCIYGMYGNCEQRNSLAWRDVMKWINYWH
jgi:hypothetical protein